MSERIFIFYRYHNTYESIKVNKLKKSDMDPDKVRAILVPLYGKSNVYMRIKPNKLFLAKRFKATLDIRLAEVMFGENRATELDTFNTKIDTTSLVEFCNFMSVLYKINGYNTGMESLQVNDYAQDVYYPVSYQIEFYDELNRLIEEISFSKKIDQYNEVDLSESYETPIFEKLLTGRMKKLNDLFLNCDAVSTSKKDRDFMSSSKQFGEFIYLNPNSGTYQRDKYLPRVSMREDLLLLSFISDWGCYFLSGLRFPGRALQRMPIDNKLYVFDNTLEVNRRLRHMQDMGIDDIAMCFSESGVYTAMHFFTISDIATLLTWLAFTEEMLGYMVTVYTLKTTGKNADSFNTQDVYILSTTLNRAFSNTTNINVEYPKALYERFGSK